MSAVNSSATILDVAAAAGVSRTTVSRVLNDPHAVKPETVERVREAVASLNFVPSSSARSMRTGRSNTIALLVGDASQPFQSALSKAVARSAEERGLSVLLCDLDHNEERLLTFLKKLPRQGVDGVVIATGDEIHGERVVEALNFVRQAGTPVVLSGRPLPGEAVGVIIDFRAIAEEATRRLVELGSCRPALVLGDESSYVGRLWSAGYTAALGETRVEATVVRSRFSETSSMEQLLSLFRAASRVDGVVAGTVPLALSAVRAAKCAGLRVPDDIRIIACEEVKLADQLVPSITTVAVTPEATGDALVRSLTALIDGHQPSLVNLPYQVTEREST